MHPDQVAKVDQLKQMVEYALDEFKAVRDVYKNAEEKMDDFKNELKRIDTVLQKYIGETAALKSRVDSISKKF